MVTSSILPNFTIDGAVTVACRIKKGSSNNKEKERPEGRQVITLGALSMHVYSTYLTLPKFVYH